MPVGRNYIDWIRAGQSGNMQVREFPEGLLAARTLQPDGSENKQQNQRGRRGEGRQPWPRPSRTLRRTSASAAHTGHARRCASTSVNSLPESSESTAHIPNCGGDGGKGSGDVPRYSETFVESRATIFSTMNGILISRVMRPESKSNPLRSQGRRQNGRSCGETACPIW